MRLSTLATSREVTLAVLVLLLLGLSGSTGRVPADILPQIPPAPVPPAAVGVAAPATPTPRSTPAPRSTPMPRPAASAGKPARGPAVPRVPIIDASPRPPAKPDTSGYPSRLTSDDLDLSVAVKPVGVTAEDEMELPDTITEVGWYRFGSHPSSTTGTTVLAAHVDTRAEGLGPFSHLRDARKGDTVTLLDRAGEAHEYRVAAVTSLAKKRIDWDQVFDRRGQPRLMLITCGGTYDQDSGYRDNVLVTAFPLP